MFTDRLPPQDIDSEEAVLGSLLIDSDAVLKVAPFLKPEHFYRDRNRYCYEACLALYERKEALNQVTVAHELDLKGRLDELGGPAYLSHLVSIIPTPLHAEHYGRIVERTAGFRRLIQVGGEIVSMGYEGAPTLEELFGKAEDALFAVRPPRTKHDFRGLRELLDTYLEEREEEVSPAGGKGQTLTSGFEALDMLLGGLQPSDLLIVAGRPGFGKSALAMNIAVNVARAHGSAVAVFSLEMGADQLTARLLSSEAKVDSHRLRLGLLTEAEERRVLDAVGALSDLPVWIDDSPLLTIAEMRAKARRLDSQYPLGLIIVDYLQLLSAGGHSRGDRVGEMSEVSKALKALARELEVVVLGVSQLSRAVEARPGHRPQLSDLRESGSIEQDADVVGMLLCEDRYWTVDEWDRHFPDKPYPENIVELIIAKHRHGPVGSVYLYFRRDQVTFESLSDETGELGNTNQPRLPINDAAGGNE